MAEEENSCDALRILDGVHDVKMGKNYKAVMKRLAKNFQGLGAGKRREAVLRAYSVPELKERFDSYDRTQDEEDWSGLVRMNETCYVCSETYIARGRQNSIGVCNNCLETHVSLRDKDIVKQEKELDILLRVYGCRQSE